MGQTKEVVVRFESADPLGDRRDFSSTLADIVHVGVYLEGPFSGDDGYCKFFLRPLSRNTQSAGQFLDVVTENTQRWLQGREAPLSVDLCDAEGRITRTIQKQNSALPMREVVEQ
jgi:hypothetical protein